ncbi:MAG TPA: hypothetical protein PLB36_03160 [Bacillota bacterium]|nr:hypothetical protein [Candidatus Fermentithermobacillaceae bacterium]HOK64254.1 hypothetical protein [Bacillota bacterium]HOL11872.1 hypothetical protein [Bacillota bacterium]HOQ02884.1 hypothetical protein [Bacillota bacterium]HPP60707.1 hypothetical protein [Bacillota bacterium]
MGKERPFPLKGLLLCIAVGLVLAPFVLRWLWFRDEYVFLTIEESSLNALSGWPMSFADIPQVFIDANEKALILSEKANLIGVHLGVHYSAVSQGVEFDEKLIFSRTGKASIDLSSPASFMISDMDGYLTELVNNDARIVKGNLEVKKTLRDGTVEITYGGQHITLKPGDVWAELLISEPTGVRAVSAADWEEEIDRCFRMGYPATRLAIANRGLWPKSNVKVGMYP